MTSDRLAQKAPTAFRSIGEAAQELGLQPHVLRFWETKFPAIKPVKRPDGRRMYRPQDMLVLHAIRSLVHEQGMTLRGAQRVLSEQGMATVLKGEARLAPATPQLLQGQDHDGNIAGEAVHRLQALVAAANAEGVFGRVAVGEHTADEAASRAASERLGQALDRLRSLQDRIEAARANVA